MKKKARSHRVNCRRNHHPKKEDKESKFTHIEIKDVSIPISVGMVPLRLLSFKSLQQTEADRVN